MKFYYIYTYRIFCLNILFTLAIITAGHALAEDKNISPIQVGWIGSITGPMAKWGMFDAAKIAEDEINNGGGIKGRPLKIIYEDTQGTGQNATSAFQKLTSIDKVSFILGGHSTPETLAFTPIAEQKRILTIAAITSNPKLTHAGDYIFRVTTVSTKQAEIIAPYVFNNKKIKSIAIIHEETDFVAPIAKTFENEFKKHGGKITSINSFTSGEHDFKSMIIKAKSTKPDTIYIGVQTPDTGLIFVKQLRELGIKSVIVANDVIGASFGIASQELKHLFEDTVFAQIRCDQSNISTKNFTDAFQKRTGVNSLPFGCYTAEPYDSTKILAKMLEICGENPECVKNELLNLKNYPGASGNITFDSNGDVDKPYQLRVIKNGKIELVV